MVGETMKHPKVKFNRDGTIEHTPPLHRFARGVSYYLTAAAGLVSFWIDLPFFDKLSASIVFAIGWFFLLGGLVNGIGHTIRVLIIELTGFALVIPATGMLAYILAQGAGDVSARAFNCLLVLSLFFKQIARAIDLYLLRKFNIKHKTDALEALKGQAD